MSLKLNIKAYRRLAAVEELWSQGRNACVSPEIIKLRDDLKMKEWVLRDHKMRCNQLSVQTVDEDVYNEHPKKKKKSSHKKQAHTQELSSDNLAKMVPEM